jgi:hypothetical protein
MALTEGERSFMKEITRDKGTENVSMDTETVLLTTLKEDTTGGVEQTKTELDAFVILHGLPPTVTTFLVEFEWKPEPIIVKYPPPADIFVGVMCWTKGLTNTKDAESANPSFGIRMLTSCNPNGVTGTRQNICVSFLDIILDSESPTNTLMFLSKFLNPFPCIVKVFPTEAWLGRTERTKAVSLLLGVNEQKSVQLL